MRVGSLVKAHVDRSPQSVLNHGMETFHAVLYRTLQNRISSAELSID
ncbi:hypothetical protein NIES2104_14940 [Leptolyngbya sp. NIES-2104]|nr:hypothetical protein NIES2104_14940 [Leptolyngbya sp. NIES-2104]